MRFADLLNRHAGQTAWICGTGPSLDLVGEITGPRIFLNRAAFDLPAEDGATYWLVCDDAWAQGVPGPWREHLSRVRSGSAKTVGVFRDPLMNGKGLTTDPPAGKNIVTFGVGFQPRRDLLKFNRQDIADAEMLYQNAGTAAPAVHLAWLMGCDAVIFAGIDGTDGYAKRLMKYYTSPSRGGLGYRFSFEDAADTARLLGITITLLGSGERINAIV